MKKILIIGSSYSVRDTFSKKFNNNSISYLNFREAWLNKKIETYEIIIVSGFHHEQINRKFSYFEEYILNYLKFLQNLKLNCNQLVLISTFIPEKISFSRVVFFYKILTESISKSENIKILSFKKIIHERNRKNIILKVLKFFGLGFTIQLDLIKNTDKFIIKKIPKPNFFFLRIRRNMYIERILRLFDVG